MFLSKNMAGLFRFKEENMILFLHAVEYCRLLDKAYIGVKFHCFSRKNTKILQRENRQRHKEVRHFDQV